ncbi:MAG: recombinase RecA [Planctomycetota bacterium]|jgi:recombination protein RecA
MARKKKKKKKSKPNLAEAANPLEATVADIKESFGEGAIMRLGDDVALDIPSISTGAMSLDMALGVGGVPRGRVVEIYGPESSGKTTLALTITANAQKTGGIAAFIDAEHALDPSWARKLGVNLDDLLVSQPDTGEQALEICERLVRSNAVDIVVIDSVAALVPRAEIEGEMGQTQVGLQARLMSQALRKLAGVIHKTRTCVIFINQIRMKIGVMWGSPETTSGGRALKFYASVRIDIRRIGSIKDGDEHIGNQTRARVVKNKVAPPFRTAEFEIMFGRGISWEGTLLDIGAEMNIVEKSGAWYSYSGTRLGQGKEQARELLVQNKDIAAEIERGIRRQHAIDSGLEVEEEEIPQAESPEAAATPDAAKDVKAVGKAKGGKKPKGKAAKEA